MNNENQNMGGEVSINSMNGMNVSTQLEPQVQNEPANQQVAMMSAASVDSSAPLNIGVVNPLNGAMEIPVEEEDEVEKPSKTAAELDLERRNKSGLRFIIIFGLLVLIFIILLPFLITIF